jgi:hypothetical protein
MTEQWNFKDARFMTAREKVQVIRAWERFVENHFRFQDFTRALYNHLSLHCSFIAHYDRYGFYNEYFESPEPTTRFMHQFDRDFGNVSVEYGGTSWLVQEEYRDINSAMCEVLDQYKTGIYLLLTQAARRRDLGLAKRLLERHGVKPPKEIEEGKDGGYLVAEPKNVRFTERLSTTVPAAQPS